MTIRHTRRSALACSILFACALPVLTLSPAAQAADPFPNRPVRLVVPYSPGGGTDVLTRPLAQRLSEITGQSFVVDNKPGADASIGAALVARAAPDGYSLVAVSGVPFLLNQSAYKSLPYDTMKDLVPVAVFASTPMILVTSTGLSVNDAKGLVAYAKANPNKLSYAGTDQMTFLGMELITRGTGTDMTHVPYKGAGPALTDLLGNHIQLMLSSVGAAIPYLKDGRMNALAIASGKRSPALPSVPTVSETILPGYELTAWFAVFAPAGTPQTIIDKLGSDIATALKTPAVSQKFEALGSDVFYLGPRQAGAFVAAEFAKWTRAFNDANTTGAKR